VSDEGVTDRVIVHGDLFDVLPTLAEASIDACVTDPPYGIGFMGREWDTFKPGTGKHRRLMHPRERIASKNPNIDGRHRSPAMSPSQIDYDYSTAGLRSFQQWTAKWSAEVLRVLKPGAYIVVCGAPRSHHRMMCGLEDAGFVVRDCFAWLFGSGFPKNKNLGNGRGTALKPAHEPIALAWKPFKGTISGNVERFGTGALNIDACRIDGPGWTKQNGASGNGFRTGKFMGGVGVGDPTQVGELRESNDLGRWPANVLLDEDAAAQLDEMTGELVSGANPTSRSSDQFRDVYGAFKGQPICEPARGRDVGGASRFYYVAKPSRRGTRLRHRKPDRAGARRIPQSWQSRRRQPAQSRTPTTRQFPSDGEAHRVDALARATRDPARRDGARSIHRLRYDGDRVPLRAAGVYRDRTRS
jgi:hypothetical protein